MNDELNAALREWCDWIYLQADLKARTHGAGGAPLYWHNGDAMIDLADWRTHMSIRERRVFEAAMALGIWTPPA